ncbi:MAG: NfeD family protein [Alicyclobacillaceae bacterium]|nr:NfeD family protein [Alicyclobacillaceae bacterium]
MAWWIWWLLAFALGAIELLTLTFVLLWIAIAAWLTGLFALAVPNLLYQTIVFVVAGVGLFVATRRWSRARRRARSDLHASDPLVGQRAVVISGTQAAGGLATVRVRGEVWSAVSDEPLVAGDEVVVERADSPVLRVRPATAAGAARNASDGSATGGDARESG